MREIRRSLRRIDRRTVRRVGRRVIRRRGCFILPAIVFIALMYAAGYATSPAGHSSAPGGNVSAPDSPSDAATPDAPSADSGSQARDDAPSDARGDYRTDAPEVRAAADIPSPRWSADEPVYHVSKVVDGDTIRLSNDEKVRLLGVDTPETVHPSKPVQYFGKEASAFTKREIGKRDARLTYDQDRRDRYGRLLAYVWRVPDDFFLDAEIISQGYGFAYVKYPFKYMDEFVALERAAREDKRGLWADEGRIGTPAG